MTKEANIFHIAQLSDFQNREPGDDYQPTSLEEGFIHCCDKGQIGGVLSRYYRGVDDITLLRLDVAKLQFELVYENTSGGSELFPHIYGPINAEAIIEAIPFGLESSERLKLDE